MDKGNCSRREAAKVVWTYAGTMAGVPETIQSRAGGEVRVVSELKQAEKTHGTLTLVLGAKDEERNQAIVLLNLLKNKK